MAEAKVKIKGDGSDAEQALKDVRKEAEKTDKALEDTGKSGVDMGKAMAGAAVAAAALAAAGAAVSASIAVFAERNQAAADTLGGLSARMKDTQAAVGEAIFESEGFQEALGRVDQVLGYVTANADTLANVVSGALTFAIDTAIVAVDAWTTAQAGVETAIVLGEAAIDAMATAVVNASSQVTILTNAVLDFGLGIAQGVVGTLDSAIGAIEGFITAAEPIAALAGVSFGSATEALGGFREQMQGTVQGIEDLRAGIAASSAEQQRMIDANNEALGQRQYERVGELTEIYEEYDQAITATAGSQAHAVEGLRETGRAARETAGAVAALTEATAALVDKQAMLLQRQIEQQKAAAEGKAAAGAAAEEAEALAALQAKYAQTEQMQADHFARMQAQEDARKAAIQAAVDARTAQADAERSIVTDSQAAIVAAMVQGGKGAAKAAAAAVAGVLEAKAVEQAILGAANLIPPPFNPTGNPLIGLRQLGIAAAAKAGAMAVRAAAGGGGGGGQGLSAVGAGQVPLPGSATAAPQSSTVVTNNFGIVGDPRAAARMIRDSLAYGQADGL